MRSRGGREISEGIWPSRGTWARESRTKRSATSCSETSSRFDPACVVEFLPSRFRHEPGLIDAPHPRRAPPIGRRAHDVDRLLERRRVEDECLELATFPARVDGVRLLKAEEISDDPLVPSPAEQARVGAFGRYAGEGDIEARLEIVVHEASRVMAPQWREDPQSELIGDAIHPRMLVVRSDGPNDHAIDVDSPKDPSQRVELTVLPRRGGLPDQGDPYSLRLEVREVQVRRVEEHRVVILREDGEKMRHVPAPLHRDVGRVGGVLPSGEQGGRAHARWRAMEEKRLRDPMLTLFKVDRSSTFANHLWPSRRFHRVRLDELTSEESAAVAKKIPGASVPLEPLGDTVRTFPFG